MMSNKIIEVKKKKTVLSLRYTYLDQALKLSERPIYTGLKYGMSVSMRVLRQKKNSPL